MTGFEPRTSGVESDCSANWATTTAWNYYVSWFIIVCPTGSCKQKWFIKSISFSYLRNNKQVNFRCPTRVKKIRQKAFKVKHFRRWFSIQWSCQSRESHASNFYAIRLDKKANKQTDKCALGTTVWPDKNRQISIKVAQKWFHWKN